MAISTERPGLTATSLATRMALALFVPLLLAACGAAATGASRGTCATCGSADRPHASFEPFDWGKRPPRADAATLGRPVRSAISRQSALVGVAYRFYRRIVSSFDGARCGHYPTCSAYALQAVERWGLATGALLAFERVTSSAGRSSAIRTQPAVVVHGVARFLDRLDDNDFWLRGVPAEGPK